MGGLLPDRSPARSSDCWITTCGSSSTKWAVFSHHNKPSTWVFRRYFGKFNKSRQDQWVFGDRDSGSYLHRFGWTSIVRHQRVKPGASPDDPALTEYWARRRRKVTLPINNTSLWLYRVQEGSCVICHGVLSAVEDRPQLPHQWERWLASADLSVIKTERIAAIPGTAEYRLIHARCHPANGPDLCPPQTPTGRA